MGMAPYADAERANVAAEKLRKLVVLDEASEGLSFRLAGDLSTNYCYEYLRDTFERVRFDTVAAATQLYTEEMMVSWVKAAVKKTGIRKIVAGGGVFMNVKANMLIAQLPEVDRIYVMPSAADESLSIGAALHHYHSCEQSTSMAESTLETLYLGSEFSREEEELAIKEELVDVDCNVLETSDVNEKIVEALVKGEVVARCVGRMEWGARSLGNRSILASAHDYRIVEKLNSKIKQRDFWMPFAPSVREEACSRYFDDDKDLKPWFMTFAFPGTQLAIEELSAGTQQRDHTLRAQCVTKSANPDYHEILTKFEDITGRGGLVNTSFNLHGEPIVYSPRDAARVFRLSGLDHLALGHYFISKKPA
jgi:carbamoyltransferase